MKKGWLVSDKTCYGCKYYGTLQKSTSTRCCDYTYITGKIRKNKPSACEVKVIGKQARRKAVPISLKGGRKRGRSQMDQDHHGHL